MSVYVDACWWQIGVAGHVDWTCSCKRRKNGKEMLSEVTKQDVH